MTPMRSLVITCLVLATAGCSGAAVFQAGNVTVADESGLVTAVDEAEASAVTAPTAVAGDSLTKVMVSWPGDSCVENWLVRLAGNALLLTIEPGTRLPGCGGVAADRAVMLTLNRVVDAGAIDVSQAGEP